MKQAVFILICIFLGMFGPAQTTYNADVSIISMTLVAAEKPKTGVIDEPTINNLATVSTNTASRIKVPGTDKPLPSYFKGSVTVRNDSVDQINETQLIVILPPYVIAWSFSGNGVVYNAVKAFNGYDGYIVYNLGKLSKGQTVTAEFGFKRAPEFAPRVYAFIFSDSTDPNFRNNIKEVSF